MSGRHYQLEGFVQSFDQWPERHQLADTTRILILEWVMSCADTPYRGARREPGFENYWFTMIPGTVSHGTAVFCSYWIFESTYVVRCDNYAVLTLPA